MCVCTEVCAIGVPMLDQCESRQCRCSGAGSPASCRSLLSVLWSSLIDKASNMLSAQIFMRCCTPGHAALVFSRDLRLSIGTTIRAWNPRQCSDKNNLKPMQDVPPPPRWLCGFLPLHHHSTQRKRTKPVADTQTTDATNGWKQLEVPSSFNGCDSKIPCWA